MANRQVLGRIAALLAACALAPACSSGGMHTPARGEIVIAQLDSPQTMNPLSFTAGYDRALLFPYLLRVGRKGELEPDLAQSVPTRENGGISADGRTITYTLRSNAKWSDGRPITANDVVFTYDALRQPSSIIVVPSIYREIDSVTAAGTHRVRVRLQRPDWSLTALFLTPSTPVVPAHAFAKGPAQVGVRDNPLASDPIGAGPYAFVRWSRDNYLLLRANRSYFGPKAKAPYLRIRFMANDAQYVGLLDKSLDVATDVPTSEYEKVKSVPGYNVFVSPMPGYAALYFNMRKSLVDDVNARKAIVLGIDQAFVARTATYGIAKAYTGLEGAFSPYHDPRIELPHYNPSQAGALLDALGWRRGPGGIRQKNGVPLDLHLIFVDDAESRRAALLIQEQEQRIGVRVLLKAYSPTQIVAPASQSGPLASGSFDILFANILGYSGLLPRWWFFCASDYNENPGHYCNRSAEASYRSAMAAPTAQRVKRNFDDLERTFVSDLAVVPLWQRFRIDVCRNHVAGCDSGAVPPTSLSYRLRRTGAR